MTPPIGIGEDLDMLFQKAMESGCYTATLAELGVGQWTYGRDATLPRCLLANHRTDLLLPLLEAIRAQQGSDTYATELLPLAVYHHMAEVVRYLLALKPSQEIQNRALNITMAYPGRQEMIEVLQPNLAAWTPVETHLYSDSVVSPLFVAILYGGEAVPALVQHGALLEERDNKGYTPFLAASAKCLLTAMKALAVAGANVRATTDDGDNALHLAIGRYRPRPDVFDFLLRLGVDPLQPDAQQRTPLDLAKQYKETEIITLLQAWLARS